MLQNDPTKLSQFRNSISYFKTSAITATALIESFFALFSDTTSSALGTLIREVADLYEDKAKSDALRTAWNDWRAINEDYPSLPVTSNPNSSSIPLGWANKTSNAASSSGPSSSSKSTRVLKLKSSTAQSSRSSVSQTRSWGGTSTPSSSVVPSAQPYPSLPPPAGSASRTGKGTSSCAERQYQGSRWGRHVSRAAAGKETSEYDFWVWQWDGAEGSGGEFVV
ncbi:putative LIM domain and RING finger protein [Glarea lozoyensis 74030]|uniref:Putative LIM domain and RING finger protein n=1 Tax=Glarea lozoyensis (strain ATCC 74030 / MF5533) TaxID=1104152 RepID=H0EHM4_GLAL7|nr:putative LIM domain and RING finger protein [Glarea lozoyensis 74030]